MTAGARISNLPGPQHVATDHAVEVPPLVGIRDQVKVPGVRFRSQLLLQPSERCKVLDREAVAVKDRGPVRDLPPFGDTGRHLPDLRHGVIRIKLLNVPLDARPGRMFDEDVGSEQKTSRCSSVLPGQSPPVTLLAE